VDLKNSKVEASKLQNILIIDFNALIIKDNRILWGAIRTEQQNTGKIKKFFQKNIFDKSFWKFGIFLRVLIAPQRILSIVLYISRH